MNNNAFKIYKKIAERKKFKNDTKDNKIYDKFTSEKIKKPYF